MPNRPDARKRKTGRRSLAGRGVIAFLAFL
jgi:hypothetical protein